MKEAVELIFYFLDNNKNNVKLWKAIIHDGNVGIFKHFYKSDMELSEEIMKELAITEISETRGLLKKMEIFIFILFSQFPLLP